MPLTKEQLLIPRYKVKDKYPGMEAEPFRLGEIIALQWHREEEGDDFAEGFIHVPIKHIPRSFMWQSFFDLYPNIFTPLSWWSDRKIDEMPEYMKEDNIGGVYKVNWANTEPISFTLDDGDRVWICNSHIMSFFEIATEGEYLDHINQKQQ